MGKVSHNDVLDAALNEIKTATDLHLNTAEPANRAAAIADSLATKSTPTFTGPVDGDTSGRKVTVDAANSLTAGATGTATHVTLIDATVVLYVTTCTSQAITSGNTVNIGAWDVELLDPT